MPNAVYYVSFKLKKGATIPDFLVAAETLNNEYISKQNGYISWKQMSDGKEWVDILTFETIDDLESFKEASRNPNDLAKKFYSFMNPMSCKVRIYTVEREY